MILNITGNSFGTGSLRAPRNNGRGQETPDSGAGAGWQDELYVRAKVLSSDGEYALTQPYFLERNNRPAA